MSRLTAKLSFVHRTLWARDPAYRWAMLLGPPPLLGCALAALGWVVVQQAMPASSGAASQAPWAHWTRPVEREGQPFAEPPTAPLPPTDATGRFVGFQPGWTVTIHPMSLDAAMDPNVSPSSLTAFTLDQPTIPLARIVDAAPPSGLFAGLTEAFFVVQRPGLYAFSVRVTRAGTESANCLLRLGSAKHRMLRNLALNTSGQAVLNYVPTEFQLQPGLFVLSIGVGCWRGDHMAGLGDVSLMVRHPGETALIPVAADELIRPAPRNANVDPPVRLH